MKSSQVRESLPLLATTSTATSSTLFQPLTKLKQKENSCVKFQPIRPTAKHSSKQKPFRKGSVTSLLKKIYSPKQQRKDALKSNWQFVYRIASAAMVISKLKKYLC